MVADTGRCAGVLWGESRERRLYPLQRGGVSSAPRDLAEHRTGELRDGSEPRIRAWWPFFGCGEPTPNDVTLCSCARRSVRDRDIRALPGRSPGLVRSFGADQRQADPCREDRRREAERRAGELDTRGPLRAGGPAFGVLDDLRGCRGRLSGHLLRRRQRVPVGLRRDRRDVPRSVSHRESGARMTLHAGGSRCRCVGSRAACASQLPLCYDSVFG